MRHDLPMANDVWASGTAYDEYVGRWSRPVAERFLHWLAPRPGADWVEVGCGTGALTRAVLAAAEPERIVATDRSPDFIAHLSGTVADGRVDPRVGDGLALPAEDGSADYVVSGLVLNFIPGADAALQEMRRVARPGAVVAAYVWDYAQGMQMIRAFWDAAVALDPAAATLDEAVRFPLCEPGALLDVFSGAGLAEVAVTDIVVPTDFVDFHDFWSPFLSGQGPAPGYCASLDDAALTRLRERLRDTLAPDGGAIRLTARAWAVRGTAPEG